MRKLIVVGALAAMLALPSTAFGGVSISTDNADYIGVVNDKGVYYIAKHCFAENGANDVGPGYIFAAAAITPNGSWQTKTRDYLDVSLSDSRSGGWGKFGFDEARYSGNPSWPWWMKEVQVGLCMGDHPEQPSYGAGVSSSSFDPPYYNGAGELVLRIVATLNDGLADVARVTYNYRIGSSTVRLWTSVTELCAWGNNCNGNTIYVKEPKFTVSDNANDTPYNYLGDVTSSGQNACDGYGWVSVAGDPTSGTSTTRVLQCPAPDREQAWFKYDNLGTIQDDCYASCTWVIAKAATTENPDTASVVRWYGGADTPSYGLDEWARLSKGRPPFGAATDSIPGYQAPSTDCANGVDYFRRWEIGRWSPNPDGRTSDQAGFHGWEGGYGLTDCHNLYREMGPAGETFNNYFQISFR